MAKILILFGSTTGNSKNLSFFVANELKQKHHVKVHDVVELELKYSFPDNYEYYFLITSTWGIEPASLQEDFEIFWSNLDKKSIKEKKFIILGLGDKYYPHFCEGVNIIEKDIIQHQGFIFHESYKIQDDWEDQKDFIIKFLKFF